MKIKSNIIKKNEIVKTYEFSAGLEKSSKSGVSNFIYSLDASSC